MYCISGDPTRPRWLTRARARAPFSIRPRSDASAEIVEKAFGPRGGHPNTNNNNHRTKRRRRRGVDGRAAPNAPRHVSPLFAYPLFPPPRTGPRGAVRDNDRRPPRRRAPVTRPRDPRARPRRAKGVQRARRRRRRQNAAAARRVKTYFALSVRSVPARAAAPSAGTTRGRYTRVRARKRGARAIASTARLPVARGPISRAHGAGHGSLADACAPSRVPPTLYRLINCPVPLAIFCDSRIPSVYECVRVPMTKLPRSRYLL